MGKLQSEQYRKSKTKEDQKSLNLAEFSKTNIKTLKIKFNLSEHQDQHHNWENQIQLSTGKNAIHYNVKK